MTSNLCQWCGRTLDVVTTADGRIVARQCPLCLEWAPPGLPVGREPPKKPAPTRAEQKARRKVKAAREALQLQLFGGRK